MAVGLYVQRSKPRSCVKMVVPIDISGGQVSGVDSLGPTPSRIVNWEVDESGINRQRPGLASIDVNGLPSSPVIGLQRWSKYLIALTEDRYLWIVPDISPGESLEGSTSSSDTQLEGSLRPTFAIGDDHVYVAGGGRILRWGPGAAYAGVLSSSPRCTHVAALGQRLISNDLDDPSSWRWSDIGEGVWDTWPAANSANAEARPDPVIAIFENTNELFIFGSETLQVHSVGSDPTFPFEQVSTVNTGIGAPYAACRLDQEFCFLDNKRRIVISDGRSVRPISDAIQRDIRGLSYIDDCFMFREERGQHSYVVVRFPTEKRTFVYNLKGNTWRERDYYSGVFHDDFPVGACSYWPSENKYILGSTLSAGGLLTYDEDSRQDIDGPLVAEFVSGLLNYGADGRKRSRRLQVVFRRGTAAQNATQGALEVRVKDDAKPWSDWQQIEVGGPDDYGIVKFLYFGGIFRFRQVHIRYSSSEDMSLLSIGDDITPLDIGGES